MKKPKILIIGSLNMDLVLKTKTLPTLGESLIGDEYLYIHGGKGGNSAVAATRMDANVTFLGKVGQDVFGEELIGSLKTLSIDTTHIEKDEKMRSGLAVVMVEEGGKNRILVYPEANMMISKEAVDRVFKEEFDAIILQFEIPEAVVIHACRLAKEKNIPFFVDAGPAQDFPLEKMPGAAILSPNETETFAMTGVEVTDIKSAKMAARILKARSGATYIVIKAGQQGAFIYDGKDITHLKALKVDAIDPTAAGDAFTAAMAVEYLKHQNIEKAVAFANGVGALTVTKLGAQPSIPNRQEVEVFLKENDENGFEREKK